MASEDAHWKIGPQGIPGVMTYTADTTMDMAVTIHDSDGTRLQVFHCEPGDQVHLHVSVPPGESAEVHVTFERPTVPTIPTARRRRPSRAKKGPPAVRLLPEMEALLREMEGES